MINFLVRKTLSFIALCALFSSFNLFSGEQAMAKKNMRAWLDEQNVITVSLKNEIKLDDRTKNRFGVVDSQGKTLGILKIQPNQDGISTANTVKVYLEQPISEVASLYTVIFDGTDKSPVIPRNVLNEDKYFYKGNDLGYSYKNTGTIFKIWAPTALGINVKIYDYYNSDEKSFSKKQPLLKIDNGVWTAFVPGDLKDKYYLYEITQYYGGEIKTFLVQDPYSPGSAVNSSKTYIFDMNDVNFYVPGWSEDKYVQLKNNVDAVIYELHVRDYTIDPSSGVDPAAAGKYKGLARYNTSSEDKMQTALGNLIELGITHVHLLPLFDYGTGDEAENNTTYTWYNWGYDPVLYNNVEGSYASSPNGLARYVEYKTMIQCLHSAGIGVVFDAVYNHTFKTGSADLSIFDKIVPYYFYRVKDDGTYFNGSGCKNDVATERPMVRKFILDSVQYWVKEYHIDGFRFDLMGIMDKETVQQIYKAVKILNPNAIIYGEGWQIPTGIESDKCMTQTNVQNTGVAAFNDGIRNSLIGSVFENKTRGYLQGNNRKSLITNLQQQMQGKLTGGDAKGISVATPNESINYITCHDNLCLWDKLAATMPKESKDSLLKRDMLGLGIIMTSQGVPFITEGEEFARTKQGSANSYNDNDPQVNPIDWRLKLQNKILFDFYRGLIALRKDHPAFRMDDPAMIDKNFQYFKNLPDGVIAYALTNNANNDSWKTIIVAFNNTGKAHTLSVVGDWKVVVDGNKADPNTMDIVQNDLVIPAMGMIIVHGVYDIDSFEY